MLKLEKCLEVTSGREVGVLGGCDVLTAVLIYDVHLSCHDRPVPLNMLRGTGEPTPIFQLDIFNLLTIYNQFVRKKLGFCWIILRENWSSIF